MPCKNCKKNAKNIVSQMKDVFSTPQKPKSECKKNRESEQKWLNSPEGKYFLDVTKPNSIENVLLWIFGYTPLLLGYVTMVRFIVGLFYY
tara:strand:+ start:124 stop:393 length:270 start_codon:yes stop_codon:yes gene_type:complete